MRKVFALFGEISITGINKVNEQLDKLDKQVVTASRSLNKFGKNMNSLGMEITKYFTVPIAAATAAIYKGVDAASDLNETISKSQQIFGDSSKQIEDWASTAADAFGQSKKQAIDAASTFGIFAQSAGLTGQSVVNFSKQFTVLASDFASFYNTSPEDAIIAIGAALRGESEPIRRYGVLLNDATLKQQALSMHIISNTKDALTPQQKVLAASAEIMRQSTKAQGDYARTSGGLANQQRELKARVADMTAELGQSFLPIAIKITKYLNENVVPAVSKLIDGWNKLNPTLKTSIIAIGVFIGSIGPLLILIGQMSMGIGGIAMLFAKLSVLIHIVTGAVTALIPIVTASLGPIALVTAAVIAWGVAIKELIDLKNDLKTIEDNENKLAALQKTQAELKELVAMRNTYVDLIAKQEEYKKSKNSLYDPEMLKFYREELVKIGAKAREINGGGAKKPSNTGGSAIGAGIITPTVPLIDQAPDKIHGTFNPANDVLFPVLGPEMDKATEERLAKIQEEKTRALDFEIETKLDATEQIYEIDKQLADLEIQLAEETEKEKAAKRKAGVSFAIDGVNQLFSILAQNTKNEIALNDQRTAKQIAAVQASGQSEKDKEASILKIQEQADKKKRELLRKQAIQQKAAAIFGIAVSTGMAIMQAFAQLGPIAGAVAAALVTGLGIAQGIAVANQPLPELADGALIRQQPGGVTAKIGEGDQDELILPMKTGAVELAKLILENMAAVLPKMPNFPSGGFNNTAVLGNSVERPVNVSLNIGTFIGDERGLKDLERKLATVRIYEAQRNGAV